MTYYSLNACKQLIDLYLDHDGECFTVEEGVLGLGTVICTAPGYKTAVIKEVYLNEWSSAHTIRQYNETPKKYQAMIDNTQYSSTYETWSCTY